MTIHKSQGGTFDQIVYEYDKNQQQQIVYVALSRVTSIEGLFIINKKDDFKFYHGKKTAVSTIELQTEFRRLALNQLETIDACLTGFITKRRGLSMFTLNCQSLRAHCNDFNDKVVQRSNILLLSETWMDNEEQFDISNFDCIVQYKRPDVKAGGVAIYKNRSDGVHVVTPHMDINVQQLDHISVNATPIGEICACECLMENRQKMMMVVIYISPGKKVTDIIKFIHRALAVYSTQVATIVDPELGRLPMILSGDFNINFASEDAQPLVEFLKNKFDLKINNDRLEATTRSGSTIDAIFERYLENLQSRMYISYFSYHKPIVSFLAEGEENEEVNLEQEPE